MQQGGHLAQYAPPAELLLQPANDFVARFVGVDRGLKRLSLLDVSDVGLAEAVTARVGEDADEIRRRSDVPHVLLLDADDKPAGWINLSRSETPSSGRGGRSIVAIVTFETTLRDALACNSHGRANRGRGRRTRTLRGGADTGRARGGVSRVARARTRARGGLASVLFPMRAGEDPILWDWTFNHLGDIGQRVVEHLELTFIAVGVGFVLAALLSLAIRERPGLYAPGTWFTAACVHDPSLALFALLVPITGSPC